MKLVSLLSFTALAVRVSADGFYDEAHNVTCTPDEDNYLTCESGHLDDAEVLDVAAAEEDHALEKRLSCGLPGIASGACLAHCYVIGYCNSYCDKGICRCRCYDEQPYFGCLGRTSCD